ncbi:fibulin-7-like [Tiliqua scincoides]|uniref:fibulin-7-like n=1 Tax=Tiliqua scincoides TaxID=71010 RepID=UPI0034622EBA
MLPNILALVALAVLQLPLSNSQGCLSKQQVTNTIWQMQKLLSSHEAAQLQSLRNLKKQLTVLQGNVNKHSAKRNESCSLLPAPANGRRLGKKMVVGHEVHFVCDLGFLLVGSETRVCLENRTWSGQQPLCKSINDCASNPCANGGTCVDGILRYSCLCPSGWSGSTCQVPLYSYWVTLSNSSFHRQPRCADTPLGSRQCSCDAGFQMRAGGLCQDVDECQIFQSSRHSRICSHECVNLPGSYRCTCPEGYQLQTDKNTCNDVDECAENHHNCSHGQTCINIFGGFRCVRPECPKAQLNTSYVKTSALQCERSPCPMDSKACQRAANSISFHYVPLQSSRPVPRVLFKMSTSHFVGDSLRFAILGGNAQGKLVVQRLDRHTGELVLTRPAVGPMTLEAEVEMSEYAQKVLLGKHIFKVTVFVSQYEF